MINNRNDDKILQNPLFDEIRNYLENTSNTGKIIYVIVPYVKADILEKLLKNINAQIVVITSWNEKDLIFGTSDVNVYKICQQLGAKLYIHNKIHLKIYSVDFDDVILSSANVSRRGLGIDTDNSNVECATLIQNLSNNDRLYLASIQKDAVLIDEKMYLKVKAWLAKQVKPVIIDRHEIHNMLCEKKAFLMSALPMSYSIDELVQCYDDIENNRIINDVEVRNCAFHDITNYSISHGLTLVDFRINLKKAFFEHPFIIKIDEFIENGAQFGAIKAWIQDNCTDVPVPSRRELTVNVQVLLEWFVSLGDGLYVVDIPGKHSQRIYKVKHTS